MKRTRQGVRDLDGTQSNQRCVSQVDACLHEYEHAKDCSCPDDLMWPEDRVMARCVFRCRKCGKRMP